MPGYTSYTMKEYENPPLRSLSTRGMDVWLPYAEEQLGVKKGGKDHKGRDCKEPIKRYNCGGDHVP